MTRTLSLADLVRSKTTKSPGYRKRSIIDYTQSDQGLKQSLFPAQKVILKLFNNEELMRDIPAEREHQIRLWHPIEQTFDYRLSEYEYAELLHQQGRLNKHPDHIFDKPNIEYLLPLGRRGTKSTLTSVLIAYELDELERIPNPQRYFGIAENDMMAVTYVALGMESAKKLFKKSTNIIQAAPGLSRFAVEKASSTSFKMFTQNDLENPRFDERGFRTHSIELSAHPNSPGVRGDNNFIYVMEEMAHYNISDKSTKEAPLDSRIHDALAPSASSYKHPSLARMKELHDMDERYPAPDPSIADKPFGKGYLISSPLGEKGKFFELCEQANEEGDNSNRLMLNIPTWEINPQVSVEYYFNQWKDNPTSFKREYGAQFIRGGNRWIDKLPLFYRAFDSRLNPDEGSVGDPNTLHFAGLDFAASNDGVALVVVSKAMHFDDHMYRHEKAGEYWTPEGKPKELLFNGERKVLLDENGNPLSDEITKLHPYQEYDLTKERFLVQYSGVYYPDEEGVLNMNDVMTWISAVWSRYKMFAGIFDQWAGEVIQQQIDATPGLYHIKKVNFGEAMNSEVAKTFLNILYSDQLRMRPNEEEEDELLGLNEISKRKHMIKVERPATEGHDDYYSALSRAVYLAKAFYDAQKSNNMSLLETLLGTEIAGQISDRSMRRVGDPRGVPMQRRPVAATIQKNFHKAFTGSHSTTLYGYGGIRPARARRR